MKLVFASCNAEGTVGREYIPSKGGLPVAYRETIGPYQGYPARSYANPFEQELVGRMVRPETRPRLPARLGSPSSRPHAATVKYIFTWHSAEGLREAGRSSLDPKSSMPYIARLELQ